MKHNKNPTLLGILAHPNNRSVSAKFFQFSIVLIIIPIGFLLLNMKLGIITVEISAIFSVLLVNVILGVYAWGAYREELREYEEKVGKTKESRSSASNKKSN